MEERKMVSVFKGLAPLSFPSEWLTGMKRESFSSNGREAFIKFANGKAFGIIVESDGPVVHRSVRLLNAEESVRIEWRGPTAPFEPYNSALIFGHGKVIALDEIEGEYND